MQQATMKHPAALRRALIRQREGKAPKDGLLFDQKQLVGLDPVQAGSLPLPAPALKEEPVLLEVGNYSKSARWSSSFIDELLLGVVRLCTLPLLSVFDQQSTAAALCSCHSHG